MFPLGITTGRDAGFLFLFLAVEEGEFLRVLEVVGATSEGCSGLDVELELEFSGESTVTLGMELPPHSALLFIRF